MTDHAVLALEDGSVFLGRSIGAEGESVGELVFNTAMTGYQEILTDPSYARQLVTLTHPHIGNTGCNTTDEESAGLAAAGLIVRDCPARHSNWRARESLPDFLVRKGIVAISDIDTRRLTRILREKGAQGGAIIAGKSSDRDRAVKLARSFPGMKGMDLAREVTTRAPYEWSEGSWDLDSCQWNETASERHVVAYDFGVKRNILRMLVDRGCRVTVVPATLPAEQALALQPDGIFLSNGPGDPEPCDYAIAAIREFIRSEGQDDPQAVSRRCSAIAQLARFPTEESKVLLNELVRSKGFLGLAKSPRSIRQTAKTTLESMP